MQLNITTDYAIRIVSYLAIRGELVNSETIASVMGIPRGYVLKITKKLVRAGIAARVIGAQSGFLLDKGPEKISLYEIINIMEPTTRLNRCLEEDKYCSRFTTENCPVRFFYSGLQKLLETKSQEMTVADLLQ
jgi:transcriptional regulator, Rrf2 family